MGLFDSKYSQKEYNQNSVLMKNAISELLSQMSGADFDKDIYGIRSLLTCALASLEQEPHTIGDKKVMRAMDKRLLGLLDIMKKDLYDENYAMLSAHANILTSTLRRSRLYGNEWFTFEEMRAQEIVAETYALIEGELRKRDSIYKRMREIEDSVSDVDEDSVKYKILEQEYTDLEQTLNSINDSIRKYKQRYNDNIQIIEDRQQIGYTVLPEHIESVADFVRQARKINRELIYSFNTPIEPFDEPIDRRVEPSSRLRRLFDEKRKEQLMNEIGSADIPVTESSVSNTCKKSLNNKE